MREQRNDDSARHRPCLPHLRRERVGTAPCNEHDCGTNVFANRRDLSRNAIFTSVRQNRMPRSSNCGVHRPKNSMRVSAFVKSDRLYRAVRISSSDFEACRTVKGERANIWHAKRSILTSL